MSVFAISASGLRAATQRLNVGADNKANLTTPGFRSRRADAVETAGGGTSIGSIRVRLSQGPLELDAGGPFSLAVAGEGYFQVDTPEGPRFTRAGNFALDAEGRVTDTDGNPLSPEIRVPDDATGVHVSPEGSVTALFADGGSQPVGQIELARFRNPEGLRDEGGNLLAAGGVSGPPLTGAPGSDILGRVVFGALEGSNTDLAREQVAEIVNLALARANAGVIRTQDEILGTVLDLEA